MADKGLIGKMRNALVGPPPKTQAELDRAERKAKMEFNKKMQKLKSGLDRGVKNLTARKSDLVKRATSLADEGRVKEADMYAKLYAQTEKMQHRLEDKRLKVDFYLAKLETVQLATEAMGGFVSISAEVEKVANNLESKISELGGEGINLEDFDATIEGVFQQIDDMMGTETEYEPSGSETEELGAIWAKILEADEEKGKTKEPAVIVRTRKQSESNEDAEHAERVKKMERLKSGE